MKPVTSSLLYYIIHLSMLWGYLHPVGTMEVMYSGVLCTSLSNSAISDVTLIAWNCPCWLYLHHRSQPMLKTKPFSPRELVFRHLLVSHETRMSAGRARFLASPSLPLVDFEAPQENKIKKKSWTNYIAAMNMKR